jgi:hypothetical protein
MNPMDLVKFVQAHIPAPDQVHALAALSDAPPEDYIPKIRLPTQNTLPAFKIGDDSPGSILAGQNYGVPAPVFGEKGSEPPTIGQLLVGEVDGNV